MEPQSTSASAEKFSHLCAIIDAETCARRGVQPVEMARELRDAGVRLLQYRDKKNHSQRILLPAKAIAEAFANTDAMLVMNDRADLAALLGWGVHVGEDDLPVADAKRLIAQNARSMIGFSTHDESQLRAAAKSDADYIAIGPVFVTTTKEAASACVGLAGVRLARALTSKPIVAIGGITLSNARSVLDAGADSIAVISGLFIDGLSVREAARKFLEL